MPNSRWAQYRRMLRALTVWGWRPAVKTSAKFTHAANAQGRRLVRHLTLPWLPLLREGDYPAVTFAEPEVAQIGPP
ncbi:hypothetical protein, partial [Desulfosarcina sp.]|uniref:hypothetical protein n=1 Tax=Desulfosarcina sp. TaxID=2027861 RepID=UPI0039710331